MQAQPEMKVRNEVDSTSRRSTFRRGRFFLDVFQISISVFHRFTVFAFNTSISTLSTFYRGPFFLSMFEKFRIFELSASLRSSIKKKSYKTCARAPETQQCSRIHHRIFARSVNNTRHIANKFIFNFTAIVIMLHNFFKKN